MYYLVLQTATVDKAERYDETLDSDAWEPIASTQLKNENEAKIAILEMLLESLNDESYVPDNSWLRLAHYNEKATKIVKVEVF